MDNTKKSDTVSIHLPNGNVHQLIIKNTVVTDDDIIRLRELMGTAEHIEAVWEPLDAPFEFVHDGVGDFAQAMVRYEDNIPKTNYIQSKDKHLDGFACY